MEVKTPKHRSGRVLGQHGLPELSGVLSSVLPTGKGKLMFVSAGFPGKLKTTSLPLHEIKKLKVKKGLRCT